MHLPSPPAPIHAGGGPRKPRSPHSAGTAVCRVPFSLGENRCSQPGWGLLRPPPGLFRDGAGGGRAWGSVRTLSTIPLSPGPRAHSPGPRWRGTAPPAVQAVRNFFSANFPHPPRGLLRSGGDGRGGTEGSRCEGSAVQSPARPARPAPFRLLTSPETDPGFWDPSGSFCRAFVYQGYRANAAARRGP